MPKEQLYRIRHKDGSHINNKQNEDGWYSAIQFNHKNNLTGPLEFQPVTQPTFTERIIDEAIIPAVATAAENIIMDLVCIAKDYVVYDLYPTIKVKVLQSFKSKEKQIHDESVENNLLENIQYESRKVYHTEEEIDQIVNNLKFAALYLACGIKELTNTIVTNTDQSRANEIQAKLNELSTAEVKKQLDYLLSDANSYLLDKATYELLSAFRNNQIIVNNEIKPIQSYLENIIN